MLDQGGGRALSLGQLCGDQTVTNPLQSLEQLRIDLKYYIYNRVEKVCMLGKKSNGMDHLENLASIFGAFSVIL